MKTLLLSLLTITALGLTGCAHFGHGCCGSKAATCAEKKCESCGKADCKESKDCKKCSDKDAGCDVSEKK